MIAADVIILKKFGMKRAMDIEKIRYINNEREQVKRIYEFFDESVRLTRSKAARVEFLTTVKYIEQALKPGARILDIGAGAGEYSLYFASAGYETDALELSEHNVCEFKKKIKPDMRIKLYQGDALELDRFVVGHYDVVLLMGPLYHVHSPSDRSRAIKNAMNVLKPDGTLFASFINHDMVFMSELMHDSGYFSSGDYDHETMRLNDFPFVFFTVPECRAMLEDEGLKIIKEVASDGPSELMAERINSMTDSDYGQYLKYHFMCCEKPEMLGFSNHLLFAAKK